MTIARKPTVKQPTTTPPVDEKAAEAFISGAGKKQMQPETEEAGKKPAMIRFDPDLLKKIDAAAKRRGVSRSAWIQFVCSRELEKGDM